MFSKTALDLWKEEIELPGIVTLCRDLDEAIGNGIPIGVITELTGPPGCGKTQICLQLCVNVQINKILNGLEGAAIYIDTNRGFTIARLKEIASSCIRHCSQIHHIHKISRPMSAFDVNTILDNILCAFCNNHVQLLAVICNLREKLLNNPRIRLIVIDSFSYLLRMIDGSLDRTRILYQVMADLQSLADEFRCAIVLTNEITTRIINSEEKYIAPALGDSHSHRVNYQITLGRDLNDKKLFLANIDKSYYKSEKMIPFTISKDGVRRCHK